MNGARIEQAKRDSERARARLDTTVGALQRRLNPKTLASDAWEGVRDKGSDLADDAVEAVRQRPVAVSAALGAVVLFLARNPVRRSVSRLINGRPDEGVVTTHVDTIDKNDINFDVAAPTVTTT